MSDNKMSGAEVLAVMRAAVGELPDMQAAPLDEVCLTVASMIEREAAQAKRIAELEIKAGQWDSLMAARNTTSVQAETVYWKAAARDPWRKVEAIQACRAAHGLSLAEALDCVEGYIARLHAEASNG